MIKTKQKKKAKTKSDEDSLTLKYKLIFLPDEDYEILSSSVSSKQTYHVLDQNKIKNFSLGQSMAVYIPECHKEFLSAKAEKGEQLN